MLADLISPHLLMPRCDRYVLLHEVGQAAWKQVGLMRNAAYPL